MAEKMMTHDKIRSALNEVLRGQELTVVNGKEVMNPRYRGSEVGAPDHVELPGFKKDFRDNFLNQFEDKLPRYATPSQLVAFLENQASHTPIGRSSGNYLRTSIEEAEKILARDYGYEPKRSPATEQKAESRPATAQPQPQSQPTRTVSAPPAAERPVASPQPVRDISYTPTTANNASAPPKVERIIEGTAENPRVIEVQGRPAAPKSSLIASLESEAPDVKPGFMDKALGVLRKVGIVGSAVAFVGYSLKGEFAEAATAAVPFGDAAVSVSQGNIKQAGIDVVDEVAFGAGSLMKAAFSEETAMLSVSMNEIRDAQTELLNEAGMIPETVNGNPALEALQNPQTFNAYYELAQKQGNNEAVDALAQFKGLEDWRLYKISQGQPDNSTSLQQRWSQEFGVSR